MSEARTVQIPGKLAAAVSSLLSRRSNNAALTAATIYGGYLIASDGIALFRIPLRRIVGKEYLSQGTEPSYEDHPEFAISIDALNVPSASDILEIDLDTGAVSVLTKSRKLVSTLQGLEKPRMNTLAEALPDELRTTSKERVTKARAGFSIAVLDRALSLARALAWKDVVFELTGPEDAPYEESAIRIVGGDGVVVGFVAPKKLELKSEVAAELDFGWSDIS